MAQAGAPRPVRNIRLILAGVVLAALLALVFSDRIPFWRGMTVLMALVAVGAGVLLRRAGEPIFKPRWRDTALGVGLALVSWQAVRFVLAWTAPWLPQLGTGAHFVAHYAVLQPVAWQYAGIVLIAPAEEILWRHYVPYLLGGYTRYRPQAIAAIAYACMHLFSGTIWLALPALAFGLAWGLLTAATRGPWAAMVWHVLFDLLMFAGGNPV